MKLFTFKFEYKEQMYNKIYIEYSLNKAKELFNDFLIENTGTKKIN